MSGVQQIKYRGFEIQQRNRHYFIIGRTESFMTLGETKDFIDEICKNKSATDDHI